MEEQSESELDQGKKMGFIKRGRSERLERTANLHVLKHQLIGSLTTNPLLKDVHCWRPATPQPFAPGGDYQTNEADIDKYRVMFLIVLVEQQQEHLSQVIARMRSIGAEESRVNIIIKVKEEMSKINTQLVSIRDNDVVAMELIGNHIDVDDYLIDVENICSAVQEIPSEGCDANKDLSNALPRGGVGKRNILKDIKVKLCREKKSHASPPDLTSAKVPERHNTPISLTRPCRQTPKAATGNITVGTKQKELYNRRKREQSKGFYPCDGAQDVWSDSDMEAEFNPLHNDTTKSNWPVLNTTDESKIKKERQLRSLMLEIDGLMEDVGLTGSKKYSKPLSYEVVMMGSGEKKGKRKNETGGNKTEKSKNQSQVGRKTRKHAQQSDHFIEELDKLLEECD